MHSMAIQRLRLSEQNRCFDDCVGLFAFPSPRPSPWPKLSRREGVPASSNVAKNILFSFLIKGPVTVVSPLVGSSLNRHILGPNLPSSEARPLSSS